MGTGLSLGKAIHDNLHWLDQEIVKASDNSLIHFAKEEWVPAINRAGSAIELLNAQIVNHLGADRPQWATIGSFYSQPEKSPHGTPGLIQSCFQKNKQITKEATENFVLRLQQANSIRNKASHGVVSELEKSTEGDANQILSILGLLVEWSGKNLFCGNHLSEEYFEKKIFMSVGTPHRLDQRQFLEKLKDRFMKEKTKVTNLSSEEYSSKKPLDQILDLMKSCDGVIVIGWDRYHGYATFEKELSKDQVIYSNILMPTAWNHIEGILAYSLNKPLLILRSTQLHPDGIFDDKSHNAKIVDFDLNKESLGITDDLLKEMLGWVNSIKKLTRSE